MKKKAVLVILVILLSLTIVMPAFAHNEYPGKACEGGGWTGNFIIAWGLKKGFHKQYAKFGEYKGRGYGPVIADSMLCPRP